MIVATLTKAQTNILDDVVRATRITRGRRIGERKGTIGSSHFDWRSVSGLLDRGLIEFGGVGPDSIRATDLGFRAWLSWRGER